ncbi:MAG TPA: hypothetical protein PK597_06585 [Oscillospiraceae bacterium]|nr:hypothetical protein [Oscillospiraceae bacterium]
MLNYFARHFGDRPDGWRVRKVNDVNWLIPYIMRTRLDSQNHFDERVSVEKVEQFIRAHRKEIPELSTMHVFVAAMVRLLALRPQLNRFVMWNKLFARNRIEMSLMVKRAFSDEGEETAIKPSFQPEDTIYDVVRRMQEEIEAKGRVGQSAGIDKTAHLLGLFPPFLLRFVIFLFRWMDNLWCVPRFIYDASPFHCSFFLTNVGSLGIGSIYHHLYEFGTCSIFLALGRKGRTASGGKTVSLRFVLDERICDGYYYAYSMRVLRRILANPDVLLTPPEEVVVDDGVTYARVDR